MEEKKKSLKISLPSALSHQDLNTPVWCFAKEVFAKSRVTLCTQAEDIKRCLSLQRRF